MPQLKISMEIKISKNYNTVTIEIPDQPINFETDEELKAAIRTYGKLLREEAENQLALIGNKPVEDANEKYSITGLK